MQQAPKIAELYVYYIKSCQGTALTSAVIGPRGITHDREWMIVDANNGVMITQRQIPELASIKPILNEEGLTVRAPRQRQSSVTVPHSLWKNGDLVTVRVWEETLPAIDQGPEINQYLSVYCNHPVRLVRLTDDLRPSRRLQNGEMVSVGFADAYPMLLTSLASLHELSRRAGQPVQMSHFRSNLVVDGERLKPFIEDEWARFIINDVTFRGVKPCARCEVVNINQHTAFRSKEPLASLSLFRREHDTIGEVLFGMYLNHLGPGTISVGDSLTDIVLGTRPPT